MVKSRAKEKPISFRLVLGEGVVQQEMLLFVLISAMDVLMTVQLLTLGESSVKGESFFESNPVAQYFNERWGLEGMVYFKFSMVGLVCVVSQIIAQRKPAVARWLLLGAIAVVAVVVVYSLMLFLQHGGFAAIDLTAARRLGALRYVV